MAKKTERQSSEKEKKSVYSFKNKPWIILKKLLPNLNIILIIYLCVLRFREFLGKVLELDELHPLADKLGACTVNVFKKDTM